ncbi:lipase [Metarhizium album ARSEF 1941]|uniref:Lipase n=1 Tax=Metarhizium album (strain ARSEF 1941) TaxID=1081103 RepID=A0A0B2WRK5_METAS|nr:lipase [Metarhizium album ARSEF 1941]KHN95615.1 lipase [Metarhizium album ARSEF 1941]
MSLRIVLGVAAIAAAKPISTVTQGDYLRTLETRGGNVEISETVFTNLKYYSQHAAAAYCNFNTAVSRPIVCTDMVCPLVMQNRPLVVASMEGELTGIGAYVAVDSARKEVVFSVRGSNNIRNYVTDVVFAWRHCDLTPECKLHIGFAEAWDEIKDAVTQAIMYAREMNPGYEVVITGHSLGGAVATIGAAYLRRDGLPANLYTYGSPRVGNDKFANWFSEQRGGQWRVTHENDPVPRLPPMFAGYRHVTPEYWLSGGDAFTTDYAISDVKICRGIANVECNASRFITDIFAHLYYFGDTGGCSGFPLRLRDTQQVDPLPQDLKDRLTTWSRRDQQFVENGEA